MLVKCLKMNVFVYGTLKRNCPNHYMLSNSENGKAQFLSEARTAELFPLIVTTKYEIPFLLDRSGIGNNVLGEVYTIDEKMLSMLDKFERSPEIYERRLEIVTPANGQKPLSAWIFIFHTFHEKLLIEKFHKNYVCNNYDLLLSVSGGKLSPEERAEILKELRG